MQRNCDKNNIQMLHDIINKMDPEEGKYHLKRCIDSGLWVPDSGEDANCAEKPVFTPSRLVVKYGDPTSATCLVCQHNCTNDSFGLEHAVGYTEKNGTTISWKVDSLTEWNTSPKCYYNDDDGNQCVTSLPITVYQPPKNVYLSFLNHSGPMFAGHQYTLQCTVQEVALISNLNVTFYRGQTELQRRQSSSTTKEPVTETFTLDINPSKDDGGLYWCEAELELGAEGPQPPPVLTSQNITATVHYKPQLKESPDPERITLTIGDPLHLNCSSEGNPSPSYTWRLPSTSRPPFSDSTLSIEAVTSTDGGQYICLVSNSVGNVTKEFTVDVNVNYIHIIIVVGVVVAVIIIAAFVVWYLKTDIFILCHHHQHVAVPVGE
ncbi:vascular cell adhesion protein 1-like [Scomber scombrus]|uniref:vascular cell adhesion protein 1-like n=1 Tax=Scomber scombrus TaxID=13677 RepID=UPI002DD7C070|nr:vascular cell adhesion protein 1-like [Scomber scombrus]